MSDNSINANSIPLKTSGFGNAADVTQKGSVQTTDEEHKLSSLKEKLITDIEISPLHDNQKQKCKSALTDAFNELEKQSGLVNSDKEQKLKNVGAELLKQVSRLTRSSD